MKRFATALVGIPLTLLITLYAPNWIFALFLAVFAALGFDELLRIGAARLNIRSARWVAALGGLVTVSFLGGPSTVLKALSAALMVSMAATAFQGTLESAVPRMAIAALGLVYCCVLSGFLVWMPPKLIVVLFGVVWVGDSAAYYGGRALGRHLLAPKISPKKTVEGAVAGLIGSIIAGVVLGRWLLSPGESVAVLIAASLIAAVAGQIGDLAESALKRSANVKDSSSILPGHGGILDRLDSLLFAAPVFYWFFSS